MKTIEEVYGKAYTFIDVRSPKEFKKDHIPGAINIPLFSNEERAIVGTIYKQQSKKEAIDKGMEIVSKKLPHMLRKYKEIKGPMCIYCWRGGMRSGSITSLLKSLKYDVVKLSGGYKEYRRYVREKLATIQLPKFTILYGLTGAGKTEILSKIENSLDLEDLAQHRGSIFGDIDLHPRSQKMFESLLLQRIFELQKEKNIFVEGESRKIGKTIIPESIWKHMQNGKKVKIICKDQERVERLYKEYCSNLDKKKLIQKTKYIEKNLGKKKTKEVIEYIQNEEIKKAVETILFDYYDKLYAHTVEKQEYIGEAHNKEELLALV